MCNHIPDGVVVILVSTELGSPKTFFALFIYSMCTNRHYLVDMQVIDSVHESYPIQEEESIYL